MIAEACVVTPKQFWAVSDLFCAVLLNAPWESNTYRAAVDGLAGIVLYYCTYQCIFSIVV